MWLDKVNTQVNNEAVFMGATIARMLQHDSTLDLVNLALEAKCITLRKMLVAAVKTISPELCVSKLTSKHVDMVFNTDRKPLWNVRVFECIDSSYCALDMDTALVVELNPHQLAMVELKFIESDLTQNGWDES
ncbi:hypothetical protein [Vibrio agarivorans]|uniref:Uncharacterized protein n=1 Tax=Vibrio agarivorans TaxID=153622 RepID=A0ABT7Y821_9VIBR|nr:hypothetical protein [Vibrio agarivorans]MDN2483904.1 hypothetical protein [Vibrio agarivorans]